MAGKNVGTVVWHRFIVHRCLTRVGKTIQERNVLLVQFSTWIIISAFEYGIYIIKHKKFNLKCKKKKKKRTSLFLSAEERCHLCVQVCLTLMCWLQSCIYAYLVVWVALFLMQAINNMATHGKTVKYWFNLTHYQ